MKILCDGCDYPYPTESFPYKCPRCGGLFNYAELPVFSTSLIDKEQKGVFRFHQIINLSKNSHAISMGEGNTPLVVHRFQDKNIFLKCEHLNPTGSYKDRGSFTLVSELIKRDIHEVIEDSSGNAGASLSAYCSRASIKTNIYIPRDTSGPKRKQIESYNAIIHDIPGTRNDTANAVMKAAEKGMAYASHAFLPFGITGISTMAWETFEQMGGDLPGSVICPVGHGGALLGLAFGFMALRASHITKRIPYLIGVQSEAFSPIVRAYESGNRIEPIDKQMTTIAEGIRINSPARGEPLLKIIQKEGGEFISVSEDDIISSHNDLASIGFFVEPTSAVVWAALKKKNSKIPEPILLILTGSGLKYNP